MISYVYSSKWRIVSGELSTLYKVFCSVVAGALTWQGITELLYNEGQYAGMSFGAAVMIALLGVTSDQ